MAEFKHNIECGGITDYGYYATENYESRIYIGIVLNGTQRKEFTNVTWYNK